MSKPTPRFQLQFLKNIQRLLAEGRFNASYKYALLLALADIAVEKGDDSGVPLNISTNAIAEKYIQYYWRQAIPYMPRGATVATMVLQQNKGSQAEIVSFVGKARNRHGESLAALKRDEKGWASLANRVSRVVEEMPLWKLQTVGKMDFDFLYENHCEGTLIELRPGVAYCLRQFYGLIGTWYEEHGHDSFAA